MTRLVLFCNLKIYSAIYLLVIMVFAMSKLWPIFTQFVHNEIGCFSTFSMKVCASFRSMVSLPSETLSWSSESASKVLPCWQWNWEHHYLKDFPRVPSSWCQPDDCRDQDCRQMTKRILQLKSGRCDVRRTLTGSWWHTLPNRARDKANSSQSQALGPLWSNGWDL